MKWRRESVAEGPVGFRVQLIAVIGEDPSAVQSSYGVVPTGRHQELPESPVVGVVLPNGAYLLFINDEIAPNDEVFARLSERASLVAFYANETNMESYVCAWAEGKRRWAVHHDSHQGLKHLETTGALPEEFPAIRDRLLAQQGDTEDTDFVFDIPLELFVAAGGIRYYQDLPNAGPKPWEVLSRLPAK